MPVFNSEKYLDKSILSIKNQTYDNWELIIVDDGSIDNSSGIIKSYASKDKRIKPIYQENLGPGLARNNGINNAHGEYIVFLDSDDYVENNYLEDINKSYENTKSDVIFVNVVQELPDGMVIKKETMSSFSLLNKEALIKAQITGKIPWGGCRKAVKADMIKIHDIRYSDDVVGEEAIYSFKILYFAKKILFLDRTYYHYVNHVDSQSKKGEVDPWGPVCNKLELYIKDIGEYEKYYCAINAFRITGFLVCISRIVEHNKVFDSYVDIRRFINDNKRYFKVKIDKASLEWRVNISLFFMRYNLIVFLIMLSYANTMRKKFRLILS